jgi:hypothetical protein
LYIPVFFFEEAWYNASQPILLGLGLPLVFLGAYQGMKTGLFGIGGWVLPKLVKTYKHRTLLLGVVILEALLWVLLGSNSLVFVIASSYVLIMIHQFWNYLDADIVHKHIPSSIRATTLSARQMLTSSIWILNPWAMGYLVKTFSRTWLFPLFGVAILLFAGIVFAFNKKHF